jgi:hypothetical protein
MKGADAPYLAERLLPREELMRVEHSRPRGERRRRRARRGAARRREPERGDEVCVRVLVWGFGLFGLRLRELGCLVESWG